MLHKTEPPKRIWLRVCRTKKKRRFRGHPQIGAFNFFLSRQGKFQKTIRSMGTDLDSHPGDASNHSCETFGSQGVFNPLRVLGGGFFFSVRCFKASKLDLNRSFPSTAYLENFDKPTFNEDGSCLFFFLIGMSRWEFYGILGGLSRTSPHSFVVMKR